MNENLMPDLEIDPDVALQQADEIEKNLQQNAEYNESLKSQEAEQSAKAEQEQAQRDDPRADGVGFNAADIGAELSAALGGGVQDTASSLLTLPERAVDMFNGEMQEAGDDYKPEWDPTGADGENLIETKTWWGGLIRGTVHFGTMAAGIIVGAKAIGAGALVAGGGGLIKSLAVGAGVGALSDLGSKYSQDDNALGVLKEHYGFIDTPITTKDTDHPAMMTLKNVVEGMGIGMVFDALGHMIKGGRGATKAVTAPDGKVKEVPDPEVTKSVERSKNVTDQVTARGKEQLNEEGFGAYKNQPIADPWQGSPTSTGKAEVAYEQLTRTRNEWGAEGGSTYSVTTPAELNRYVQSSKLSDDIIIKVAKELETAERFKSGMAEIKAGRATAKEVWGEAADMYKEMVEGRNLSDMTTEEFMAPLMEGAYTKGGVTLMSPSKVAATDLVVGSLVREARDLGLVGRELGEIADLGAKDGPAAQLVDKMVTALTETKKARYDWSQSGKELGAGVTKKPSKTLKREAQQVLKDLRNESKEALFAVLKLADEDTSDDMMKAMFEYVSGSNELRNMEDFDAWARRKLKGGELDGKKETGALVNEMGKVMVHSVLSGPKTPVRAIMGTSSAAFLRPMSMALGALLRGDKTTMRASLASMNAMTQMIPEAWGILKTKINSSFAGDVANINNRYVDPTIGPRDIEWELMAKYYDGPNAKPHEKAAWRAANIARNMNGNKILTYSTKLMQATDETFKQLMGRGMAREKALRAALENGEEITPQLMKNYETRFQAEMLDADGFVRDDALDNAIKEVTLTKQLEGFAAGLDTVFQKTPWAKPFFLFARTSVNGLELVGKHLPIVNKMIKEVDAIQNATEANLDGVLKYGITTPQQLANAKALNTGRLAVGYSVISMASLAALNGQLRGNGPTDRRMREVWKDAGWTPNSIKIGDLWVNFEAFEPFNVILSTVADITDHSQLMGEQWTKDSLQRVSLIIANGVTSKSYLQGLQQFVDLFAGDPKAFGRIVAGLANNQIPMSSLRNEIGKLLSPGMRELSSSITDQIRNRNQASEVLTGEPLPLKYDLLNGKPIREWDIPTKMWNMFSPVQINLDQGPGRTLLFESQYDMRLSTMSAPSRPPISLRDSNELRSRFAQAIGNQNLEAELDRLAKREDVQISVAQMNADRDKGGASAMGEPMDYLHNRLIKRAFDRARKKAWAEVSQDPKFVELIEEQRTLARINNSNRTGNRQARQDAVNDLQTMYK